MHKCQPPYSKHLLSIKGPAWGSSPNGMHHTFWVLFGPFAWVKAKEWQESNRRFVLSPHDKDPLNYDWRILKNHPPVLLLPCGVVSSDEVKALVVALLRDGVERVLYLGDQGGIRYVNAEGQRYAA